MLGSGLKLVYCIPSDCNSILIEKTICSILDSSTNYHDIEVYTSIDQVDSFSKLPCKTFSSDKYTTGDLFLIQVLREQYTPFMIIHPFYSIKKKRELDVDEIYLKEILNYCSIDKEVLLKLDEIHKPHYHMIVDCVNTYDISILGFNNMETKCRFIDLIDMSLDLVSKVEDTQIKEKINIQTIFQYTLNYLLQESGCIHSTITLDETSTLDSKFSFWDE